MNIGYIGAGAIGVEFARRLMQGHHVVVHQGAREAVLGLEGAMTSDDLQAIARDNDVILLCAPSSLEARAQLFGEGGLLQGLSSGKVVVDLTPGDPLETREIATVLRASGIGLVDVALHSETSSYEEGASALFYSGPDEACELVRPLLEACCPQILHCGDAGNAHAMKLITSAVAACNRLITYECAAMGVKNGLDVNHMSSVINTSSGSSSASERILPVLAARGKTADLPLAQAVHDLNLASRMAMVHGAPMLLGNLVRSTLETARHELGDHATLDDLAQLYEKSACIEFAGVVQAIN